MTSGRHRSRRIVESLEPRRLLASVAGNPDPAVGGSIIQSELLIPRATVIQNDGTILVAAAASPIGSAARDFHLLRFGESNPVTSIDFGGRDDVADAIRLAGGKLILVGSTQPTGGDVRVAVARLNPDLSLDRTFSSDGMATFDGAAAGLDLGGALTVAEQPDGKLLIGANNAVLRVNSNGTLDNSFSFDGIAPLLGDGRSGGVRSISIAPDGKIVAAAFVVGFRDEIMVTRLTTSGALDKSFSGDGRAFFGAPSTPHVVALPGNKILLTNIGGVGNAVQVRRINPDGTLDTTVGNAGSARIVLGTFPGGITLVDTLPSAIGGRFISVGRAGADIFVTQFDSGGNADANFGSSGIAMIDGFENDTPSRAAVAPDGKIVLAGLGSPTDANLAEDPAAYRVYVRRLFGTQTAPTAGITRTGTLLVQGSELPESILVQDDGDTVAASINGVTSTFPRAIVRRIAVRAGGGNDSAQIASLAGKSFEIAGENGNDTLTGNGRDNLIAGGDGNDSLHGVGGNDTLFGNDGDDQLFGGSGDDRLFGGRGADTLFGHAGNDYLNDSDTGGDGAIDILNGGSGHDLAVGSLADGDLMFDVQDEQFLN